MDKRHGWLIGLLITSLVLNGVLVYKLHESMEMTREEINAHLETVRKAREHQDQTEKTMQLVRDWKDIAERQQKVLESRIR